MMSLFKIGNFSLLHMQFAFDKGLHPGHDFVLTRIIPSKNEPLIKKLIDRIVVLRLEQNYIEADKLRDVLASLGVPISYHRDNHITWWDFRKAFKQFTLLRTRWVPTEKGTFFVAMILGWRLKLWKL